MLSAPTVPEKSKVPRTNIRSDHMRSVMPEHRARTSTINTSPNPMNRKYSTAMPHRAWSSAVSMP